MKFPLELWTVAEGQYASISMHFRVIVYILYMTTDIMGEAVSQILGRIRCLYQCGPLRTKVYYRYQGSWWFSKREVLLFASLNGNLLDIHSTQAATKQNFIVQFRKPNSF